MNHCVCRSAHGHRARPVVRSLLYSSPCLYCLPPRVARTTCASAQRVMPLLHFPAKTLACRQMPLAAHVQERRMLVLAVAWAALRGSSAAAPGRIFLLGEPSLAARHLALCMSHVVAGHGASGVE